MEGERGVTPNILDQFHSSDIQRGLIEGENSVTPSIIEELLS